MKRYFILSIVLALAVAMNAADALNAQQSKVRSDIMTFLKEEGFMPEIDSDGDIVFKREGKKWFVSINPKDENPMFLSLFKMYNYDEKYTKESISPALAELNGFKGVKIILGNHAFFLRAEIYVVNAEPLKYAFYKLIKQINSMDDELTELVGNNPTASLPLIFESASVANVEEDGTIIDNYEKIIYSYRTKYLKVKCNATVNTAGSYTFNVKFFNADGILTTSDSSPSGYSYSYKTQLEPGHKEILLYGWGSNKAGHWKAGNYKVEIYLFDKKIGEKAFTVY